MAELRRSDDALEWLEGGLVSSRLPLQPGPTQTLLDVMAAIAVMHSGPAGSIAVLGFAAGGIVAPLRALGHRGKILGVDLDLAGAKVFHDHCSDWAGDVEVVESDALEWLEQDGRSYAAVIDDLSTVDETIDEVVKPFVSIEAVPRTAAVRLLEFGVFLTNLLPWPGADWGSVIGNVALPFDHAHEIVFDDYENRVVAAGGASCFERDDMASEIITRLEAIESEQVGRFEVVG